MKKNKSRPATGQNTTVSIVKIKTSANRRKVITPKTFKEAKKRFEADLDKMFWEYFRMETNNIFQVIDLCKVIRNYADRGKRNCENIYADECYFMDGIKTLEMPELGLSGRQEKRIFKQFYKDNYEILNGKKAA